jgi:thiol:disulfide interchange protein DsbA
MFRRVLTALLILLPLAAAAAPLVDFDTKPRPGLDYDVLPTPQPIYGKGKQIEVAEVFSYACIHCSEFQPLVDAWLKKLPGDVRYEYVPAVFQPVWENFARGYLAAKVLGVQARTHDLVFKAVHVDHVFKIASVEEIADWYGSQGVNRDKFLATMKGAQVEAMLDHAKQFALRTGIQYTPTIIVAGKYRVNVRGDRGFEGMLTTTEYLLDQERAGKTAPAGNPPAASP